MKKIFPFLLIALTGLALGHFYQNHSSILKTKPAIEVANPILNSIQKKGSSQTADTSVSIKKNLEENVVNAVSSSPNVHFKGLHEKIADFYSQIPRKSSLAGLAATEMHETPQPILAAGRHLGDMHEYFLTHNHDINAELNFYLKCSQQKDFFDSARALCAARASQLFLIITGNQISSKIFDDRIAILKNQITL